MSRAALLAEMTPTPTELATYKGLETVEELDAPVAWVSTHLKLATALFLLASGATAAPDPDSPVGVVTHHGILDMAWYIGTSMEDRDAMFSPFSSERVGSYSYSKAANAARNGESTGVPFFDAALKWFAKEVGQSEADAAAEFGFQSEHVIQQPFARRLQASEMITPPAPIKAEIDGDVDYVSLFEGGQ